MAKRTSKRDNYEIEDLGDIELPPDLDEKIEKMTAIADEELEATRVNFRWQREPLSLIKAVASAMGVPYQTYMKQVLYRQALQDLAMIESSGASPSVAETTAKYTSKARKAKK